MSFIELIEDERSEVSFIELNQYLLPDFDHLACAVNTNIGP